MISQTTIVKNIANKYNDRPDSLNVFQCIELDVLQLHINQPGLTDRLKTNYRGLSNELQIRERQNKIAIYMFDKFYSDIIALILNLGADSTFNKNNATLFTVKFNELYQIIFGFLVAIDNRKSISSECDKEKLNLIINRFKKEFQILIDIFESYIKTYKNNSPKTLHLLFTEFMPKLFKCKASLAEIDILTSVFSPTERVLLSELTLDDPKPF